MEALALYILQNSSNAPTYFVLTVGVVVLGFAAFLSIRRVNITEVATLSKLQSDAVKPLLDEITHLSESLKEARSDLAKMTIKIGELEAVIKRYQDQCITCPYTP